jgi:aspartyl-tRNA(Asn)/glutamyl-tRNA(Gln) amidotransferase subunit B
MRCDVNISLTPNEDESKGLMGQRVELKNVLGLRFVEKAIEYEIRRHAKLHEEGLKVEKETRKYDALNDTTVSLRSKEEDIDYRFLVDPDIPTFHISKAIIESIKSKLPLTPF